MNATVEIRLFVTDTGAEPEVPILAVDFYGDITPDVIRDFSPARLYLTADPTPGYYSLVDEHGHRYVRVAHDDTWISAAENLGSFFLVMRTRVQNKAIVKPLLVLYPFGQVAYLSPMRESNGHDFAAEMARGGDMTRAARDLAQTAVKAQTYAAN